MNVTESEARDFVNEHVSALKPLLRTANLAAWDAATTGREEAIRESAEARAAVKQLYSQPEHFRRVRELLAAGGVHDPHLRRQLVLLDHAFTGHQLPPETIEDLTFREAELERIFYNFRATLEGVELSNNELREQLRTERDNNRRRRVWEASKMIGPLIAPLLLDLIRRRNVAARDLGFDNYYSMELALQEVDESELFELLDDFRQRSEDSFRRIRARLDDELAARHGVTPSELRPWHWDDFFSQEAPATGSLDLDPLFAPIEQETLAANYFDEVGMPVRDVLQRSDLYEREGKDQHAFCTDIDREGDVRVLCNLRADERWMRTLLHELGHAVYDKYIPTSLPFLLRTPPHMLATESIAMYFGRLTRDPDWLERHLGTTLSTAGQEEVNEQQRLSMLVSARWMLVMIYFERELYRNPDRPDLNRLWWDLVDDLQGIRRPTDRNEPDWATKIHLSLAPVYYHSYLLGELMASQLTHAMRGRETAPAAVGEFLRSNVFSHGAALPWNELLRAGTGESLSPRYFVDQYVEEPLDGGT